MKLKAGKVIGLVACICILLISRTVMAASESENLFQAGLICFGEIDFDCALENLQKAEAVEAQKNPASRRHVEILRYLAYTQIALEDNDGALQSFVRLLETDPDYRLNSAEESPKIMKLFEEALALAQKNRKGAEAQKPIEGEVSIPLEEFRIIVKEPEKQPRPAGPFASLPAIIFGGELNAALIFGEDAEYYHPGISFEAYAAGKVHPNIHLGGAVYYMFLPAKANAGAFNLLAATFNPHFSYAQKRFWLDIAADVGPAMLGRGSIIDEWGLILRVKPGFYYRIIENLSVGFNVAPGGLVLFDRRAASFHLGAGLDIRGGF